MESDFYITVYGETYGSYSLYYHLVYKNNALENISFISLDSNELIQGYINSNNGYLGYYYTADFEEDSGDLALIITHVAGEYTIYVWSPNDKIEYNELKNEFKGYSWILFDQQDYDNLVISSKSDKFVKKGKYSIIIQSDSNESIYYVAMADPVLGVQILESTPIISSNDSLKANESQTYWITLANDHNVSVDLTNYNGLVGMDILLITNESEPRTISTEKPSSLSKSFDLTQDFLEKLSVERNTFYSLSIKITFNQDYVIVSKYQLTISPSTLVSYELLTEDLIKIDSVDNSMLKYYYLYLNSGDELRAVIYFYDQDGLIFYKFFEDSSISLKSAISKIEKDKEQNFKREYWENVLLIPKEDSKKCTNACLILIGIKGESADSEYLYNQYKYEISFTTTFTEVFLNRLYTGSVISGQFKYFRLYLKAREDVSNLIFTLTSSFGDADLLINYSLTPPDFTQYDFSSVRYNTEIIQIDLQNEVFKSKNISSLEGVYTIGITSYTNSTYTLNISPSKEKLIYINDYYSSSCHAKSRQSCIFHYTSNEIADYDLSSVNPKFEFNFMSSVVYINFHYGNAKAYASIVNDSIIENIDDFIPNENKFSFSNSVERSLVYLNYTSTDYPQDFPLPLKYGQASFTSLINITCIYDCYFTISVSAIQRSSSIEYILDPMIDNIIYLFPGQVSFIIFSNYIMESFDVIIEAYDGQAIISCDLCDTLFDKLVLDSEDKQKNWYSFNDKALGSIDFYLNAQSENYSIINIRIVQEEQWFKIIPGADNTITPNMESEQNTGENSLDFDSITEFRAVNIFFDFPSNYDAVNLIVQCEFQSNCGLLIFGEFQTLTSKFEAQLLSDIVNDSFEYSDNSFKGSTTKSTDLYIKNPKNQDKHSKSNNDDDNSDKLIFKAVIFISKAISDYNTITVSLTPTTKKLAITTLEAYTPLFTQLSRSTNGIFEISKLSLAEESLTIIISLCFGTLDFKIYSNPYFELNSSNYLINDYDVESKNDRIVIKLDKVDKNLFLVVSSKSTINKHSKNKNDKATTGGMGYDIPDTDMFYGFIISYSSFNIDSILTEVNSKLIYFTKNDEYYIKFNQFNSTSSLEMPQIEKLGIDYMLFISNNAENYRKMDSICYLTNYTSSYREDKFTYSMLINKTKFELDEGMTAFKLPELTTGIHYANIEAITSYGELYGYTSIEINIPEKANPSFVIYVVIAALVFGVGIFYYLYTKTKTRLELERTDIGNMANLNRYKSNQELREMKKSQVIEGVKYSNLTEFTSEI